MFKKLLVAVLLLVGIFLLLATIPAMLAAGVLAAAGQTVTFFAILSVLGQVAFWGFLFFVLGLVCVLWGLYLYNQYKKRTHQ